MTRDNILKLVNTTPVHNRDIMALDAAQSLAKRIGYPENPDSDMSLVTLPDNFLAVVCGLKQESYFALVGNQLGSTGYRCLLQLPQNSHTSELTYMTTLIRCVQENFDSLWDTRQSRLYLGPSEDDPGLRVTPQARPFVDYPVLKINGNFGENNQDLEAHLDRIFELMRIVKG